MSVRVLTERILKPGATSQVVKQMFELRKQALFAPGFVSAEALTEILPGEVGKSDAIHKYVVYSSWASLDHWNEWARDQQRNQTAISMEKHLVSPATHRIFRVANDKGDLPLL